MGVGIVGPLFLPGTHIIYLVTSSFLVGPRKLDFCAVVCLLLQQAVDNIRIKRPKIKFSDARIQRPWKKQGLPSPKVDWMKAKKYHLIKALSSSSWGCRSRMVKYCVYLNPYGIRAQQITIEAPDSPTKRGGRFDEGEGVDFRPRRVRPIMHICSLTQVVWVAVLFSSFLGRCVFLGDTLLVWLSFVGAVDALYRQRVSKRAMEACHRGCGRCCHQQGTCPVL